MSRFIKGFTLVELVVVMGIMSFIMLFVVANSRQFSDQLLVTTAAGEVTLAMRQAQNFGISVKESQQNSNSFSSAYGIAFDLTNPTYVFIYNDTNSNRRYDGTFACAGTDECREKNSLRGGVRINRLCAAYVNGVMSCFAANNMRYLVITYVRPNPEPVIKVFDASNTEITGPWKTAYVELVSPKGTLYYVVTDSVSGQITATSTMP